MPRDKKVGLFGHRVVGLGVHRHHGPARGIRHLLEALVPGDGSRGRATVKKNASGANPTITSYDASVVKICNAANSLACF
jgi:hypothetical protein